MKSFIVVLALFCVVNFAKSQLTSEEILENAKARYMTYLKNRRTPDNITAHFESFCPGSGVKLEGVMMEVKSCADQIEEESETVCSAIKNHLMRCGRPMIALLEDCLPQESKTVPKFVFKSIVSGVKYLCMTDGEHIFELANSCIYHSSYKTSRCERKVRTKMQQFKKNTPTKSDVCEFAVSFKPCIESHLRTACGNAITREAFLGLFNAFMVPCGEANEVDEVNVNMNAETFDTK